MEKNDKKSTLYSEVPGISIQECSFILDIIRGDITFPLKKKFEVYLTYSTILVPCVQCNNSTSVYRHN